MVEAFTKVQMGESLRKMLISLVTKCIKFYPSRNDKKKGEIF